MPARFVAEPLGATVDWDPEFRRVLVFSDNSNNNQVSWPDSVDAGSRIVIYVDGEALSPDVPPTLVSGRVFVPARFIAEALGAYVGWDAANRNVLISTTGPPVIEEEEKEEEEKEEEKESSGGTENPSFGINPDNPVAIKAQYLVDNYATDSSDLEKAKVIYDWLTLNMEYDSERAKLSYIPRRFYTAITLEKRSGVCEDIARLYRDMLRSQGINADTTRRANVVLNSAGETGRHVFTNFQINGVSYAADPTWEMGRMEYWKRVFRDFDEARQYLPRIYFTTPAHLDEMYQNFSMRQGLWNEWEHEMRGGR